MPLEVNAAAAVPERDRTAPPIASPSGSPTSTRSACATRWPAPSASPQESVRVVCPAVGGGFGAKIGLYAEYVVIAAAARRLGRPVRWVETRSESMTAMTHGRAQIQDVEIGAKTDGTIVGFRGHVIADVGAYPALATFLPDAHPDDGRRRLHHPEDRRAGVGGGHQHHRRRRLPGRRPARGGGHARAGVDMVAAELGLDPVEVRRRNLIPPFEQPHTTPVGATYDVGDYARALDEVLRLAGYDELRAEQRSRRRAGRPAGARASASASTSR